MNKLDLITNALACQRFSADCAAIKTKITNLQIKNSKLSSMLDDLIAKQEISINRMKARLNVNVHV
ncbi:hypothetical protein FEM33_13860 [Dyadobacter flavalbus]|uniref:Uncharacterized protein n=1 Tax=Dyadobacter flavalbus TaxID=2579942 RepID=A0A5M8QXE0_9BACT|nr:hypothetical protein [Dyadobacter flavalbus]KAA6439346.1 hypothetical protein FEM33_13860 [Dyadobacter flavalbus]